MTSADERTAPPRYLLSYYGDDFTGSTDVMEALSLGGVPTVLFLEPPTPEQLAAFPDARAVGVAGMGRAMTPEAMNAQLPGVFKDLAALDAQFCHYKLCSTFDSSPTLGSIGRALELGLERFPQAFVPLIVGAPVLKRYVVFGHLFATAGGVTYRLDRHPTMPKHPATPMTESDVRRHLSAQTDLDTDLIDVLVLAQGAEASTERVGASAADVIVFDTLTNEHLETLGELLWRSKESIRFVAGSSGLEYALVAYLQRQGKVTPLRAPPRAAETDAIIVVSGSAAPATAAQIDEAEQRGFAPIRIGAAKLVHPDHERGEHTRLMRLARTVLAQDQSPLLYTARGPDDPALGDTRLALAALGLPSSETSRRLGTALGELLRDLLQASGIRRACITGGDTCGYAAAQLGLYALELLTPVAPGAPLCRAYAGDDADGLELALKAGQVGEPDYFLRIRDGI